MTCTDTEVGETKTWLRTEVLKSGFKAANPYGVGNNGNNDILPNRADRRREARAMRQGDGTAGHASASREQPLRAGQAAKVKPATTPRKRIVTGPYAGLPQRPREDRRRHLLLRQARELVNALAFGELKGVWPRWHITVIWRHSPDFRPEEWAALQTRLISSIRQWLARHGVRPVYVWVRENGRQKGPHTHLFISCPPRLLSALEDHIVRHGAFRDGGVMVNRHPANAHTRRLGLLKYLLKGMSQRDFRYVFAEGAVNLMDALGVEHRGDMLPVDIKRVGVCYDLGPAARERAGWRDMRQLHELAYYLNGGV